MKKYILMLFILLLVLPLFTPWLPHGLAHDFHHDQMEHHVQNESRHSHTTVKGLSQDENYAFHIDVLTYFDDYLHVDLINATHVSFDVPQGTLQDLDYVIPTFLENDMGDVTAFYKIAAPPDYHDRRVEKTSLYLSTQRLRI